MISLEIKNITFRVNSLMAKKNRELIINSFLLFFLIGGIQTLSAQCPSIITSTQTYCDLQSPTIADLIAIDNGNGIQWYDTATSITPLSSTEALVSGEDYFADDNSGICGIRESVDVIIYGPPIGFNFQGVCVDNPNDATISDLVATGNNVLWYSVLSGGLPLAPSTVLVDNTIYYAEQENPDTGCKTSRLSVFVNVGIVPSPIGNPVQVFCSTSTPTVADLVATGADNWYSTNSSVIPLNLSEPLVDGEDYFATSVDPPCESSDRLEVTVTIDEPANSGINGSLDICEVDVNTILTIDLLNELNGTPDSGGVWTGPLTTTNGDLGTVDITPMTVNGSPYVFTYTIDSGNSCGQITSTVTIAIAPEPIAGSNGSIDICGDDASQDLFTALGGSPDIGGTWSPALNSGTGIFDPSIDPPGTYTYTVTGMPPCGDASATVTVAIVPEPIAGTNGAIDICGDDASQDLFTALGGSPDIGGTWSPALNSGTGVFDPNIDPPGTYTYTVTGTSPCGDASAMVTVAIVPEPIAGSNGSIDICGDDATQDLFTALGGSPDIGGTWSPALNSGTGVFDPNIDPPGTYTYTVTGTSPCGDASATVTVAIVPEPIAGTNGAIDICGDDASQDLFTALGGSPDLGGTWSPALNSGTGVFDPSIDLPGTYTYTVTGMPPCGDASATVTVAIVPEPIAGTNGAIDICGDDASQDLFTALGGSPDLGGTWSPALNSGTGVFDPSIDLPGTYTYTVTGMPPCGDASATVTVAIVPEPIAGSNGSIDICGDDATQDLFDALGGSPDIGGTWSPALNSGTGIFDPNIDPPGTYTYTVTGMPPCGDASATVTVAIVPEPIAGSNGSIDICGDDATQDLFTALGGSPDSGGTWSPTLNSGTGVFDPNIDPPGTYTYTVTGMPPCGDASATVTVAIVPEPIAGTNGAIDICGDDASQDLFTALGGSPDLGGTWSPALNSGTGVFDPSIDPPGTYTYTVTGMPPCGDASATVTVAIVPEPIAGTNGAIDICGDDATQDLFTALGGSPDLGGTWSPALNSGTGVFDPSIDSPGTYTYTVTGMPPCGDASATVTVAIVPEPIAGSNGSIDICGDDASQDLFTALGGSPDLSGTWSPALNSGTGIFDPSIDPPGTYTYTVTGMPPCGDGSATVTVAIVPEPIAGTNGSIDICGDDASQDLFTALGGSPDIGGTWSPALNSGTGIFDPNIDPPGTYTYTVTGMPPCGDASATVTVAIVPEPIAGSNGSIDICGDDATQDLFDALGGSPDSGGTWSPALNSGTGVFDPNIDPPGSYTYTVTGTSPCVDASATVTIAIVPEPIAGTNGSIDICGDDASQDLFTALGGSPNLGGAWSPALNSGTGIFDPSIDPPGTYTYTVTGTSPCVDASATVTVAIVPEPNAGTDTTITLCINDGAQDLFSFLMGDPDSGGTWSPVLNSGTGVYDPNIDPPGDYIYTVGPNICNQSESAILTVILESNFDATGLEISTSDICLGDSDIVNLTGAVLLPDGDYTINYELSNSNNSQNLVNVTFTGGNSSFVIPSSLLLNSGVTTIIITEIIPLNANCSADISLVISLDFIIFDDLTPEIIQNGNVFCEEDNPSIEDLIGNIIGMNTITWYDAPTGGTVYSNSTFLVDGETYYASVLNSEGCESLVRLETTVQLENCPLDIIIPDGFSPNGDTINDDFDIVNIRELFPNFTLEIFNRYGSTLYKGHKNIPNWDGHSSEGSIGNTKVPVGVYFYILKFNDGIKDPIQGRVYLSR